MSMSSIALGSPLANNECSDGLQVGLPLYCKVKVDYYYHRNIKRGPFYTLHYSHVMH
jgi:hypothetical protein